MSWVEQGLRESKGRVTSITQVDRDSEVVLTYVCMPGEGKLNKKNC